MIMQYNIIHKSNRFVNPFFRIGELFFDFFAFFRIFSILPHFRHKKKRVAALF